MNQCRLSSSGSASASVSRGFVFVVLLLVAAPGCSFAPVRRADPPNFAAVASTRPAVGDPFPNWQIPPQDVEQIVHDHEMQPQTLDEIGQGLTGAGRVWLAIPERGLELEFKWKEMLRPGWLDGIPFVPGALDGVNNSPRKEIAAWRIQTLFLDPEDYVVPPSIAYCVDLERLPMGAEELRPTLDGSRCVLGVLSLWLRNAELPDPLLDADRFARDALYATYLADFNLLTYLIEHHDGRLGNFLVSGDDARRQVFAIDNGNSFGGIWYNWFVPNWSEIRVPALRRASVDRLRRLKEEDLHARLGIVAQLERDDSGFLHAVEPSQNLDDDEGVRITDRVVQLGLTDDEIDDVWERIDDLIEAVDEGDVALF